MWFWIMIGVGSFLVLSLIIGLVLGRILGTIGREISGLYEADDWVMLPPTREARDTKEDHPEEVEAESSPVDRSIQRR